MRKPLIAFAVLLVLLAILITAMPCGIPQSHNFTNVCQGDGSLWAAENRLADSYIYEIRDNTVSRALRCSRIIDGAMAELVSVSFADGAVYAAQVVSESDVWRLLSTDEEGKLAPVATLPYMTGYTLLDFYLEGGMAYLTVLDPEGAVSVLSSINYVSGGWESRLLQNPPAAGSVQSAFFRGDTLYIRYSGSNAVAVTPTGSSAISVSDLPQDPLAEQLHVPLGIRLSCKAPLFAFALCLLLILFIPIAIMTLVAQKASSFALRTPIAVIGMLTIFGFLFCGVVSAEAAMRLSVAVLPELLLRLGIALLVFIIACCVTVTLMLSRSTLPIRELSARMERVADGDYSIKDLPNRKDEIGDMYRALQELCLSLSIRDYEVSSTMRSYHRFVPRGLEELLNRASVMEVCLGDNRAIDGIAGLITVTNRQTVRAVLSDDEYVSFINRSSSLMDSSIRSQNGLPLSSGYSMESNKVYFSGGASCAVKSALDLIGNAGAMPSTRTEPAPKFFVLLHKTVLLYGIAGSEDSMFPYLSSSELEALGVLAEPMREAGVQIVMTDRFMDKLGDGCVTRYIGFVSGGDEDERFKLYELLDPYSDIERNLRISYDSQLQEAINMFYKSDFYLARNIFSSIVRACPSDGIARWYLFACEHFFHRTDDADADFRLFGTKLD